MHFLVVLYLLLGADSAVCKDKLKVVASFSILSDMVANVGGDRVDVKTLVGPESSTSIPTV